MHVNRRPWTRGALAALALLLAAGVQAQAKLPRTAASGSSGTGLRPSVQVAPSPLAQPAAAPASAPAAAASASPGAAHAEPASEQEIAASAAAAGWLTLLDRRDWGSAWETTAGMFRSSVPLDKWMDGIPKVRGDVGAMVERVPTTVSSKTELPGKPKGEYVTVLFTTRFEKRTVDEVVTTVREQDGRWRVAGYSQR